MARLNLIILALFGLCAAIPARAAVSPADRLDASTFARELPNREQPQSTAPQSPVVETQVGRVALREPVIVGAIRVEGALVLSQSDFAPIVESYVGRALDPEQLRSLASEIANLARQRGFGLATAWIPPQRLVQGILRVSLDEGRIDALRVTGDAAASVEHVLSALKTGRPVRTDELERRLLVAEDMAGVRLGRARLERSGRRNILAVKTLYERVQAYAHMDNWGSSAVGPVRLQLTADLNGLVARDDRLTVSGMVTPLQPRELRLLRLAYSKAIGTQGTQVTVGGYYARTRAGGAVKRADIAGLSRFAELIVSHPLLRSRTTSAWASLQLGLLDTHQNRTDRRFRDDRITTIGASLYATTGDDQRRLRARLTVVQGVGALAATERGDRMASRFDGSGRFSKVQLWAAFDQELGGPFSLGTQLFGQIASGPLLASEEMGLGGRTFLRAFDYRELSGDKGLAGSAELRFDVDRPPLSIRHAQIYLFGDAGIVGNYRNGYGSGSLVSAGAGARLQVSDRIEAGLEFAIPLTEGAIEAVDYDPRLSFTLGGTF